VIIASERLKRPPEVCLLASPDYSKADHYGRI